jgi:quinol monooxygenase YgiN/quercetin dioxygenase-like cupin family protein
MRLARGLLLDVMVLAMLPAAVMAQDPVPRYPRNYRILVENDRVRVLDFRLRKGDTEETHSHPAHVLYVLEPFTIRFALPGGRTAVREAKAGDVLFSEAVTHSPTNIGNTDAHGILIELRAPDAAQEVSQALTAVTLIRGKGGAEDEVKRELLSLTPGTRAEPGNLGYDLYQSVDRPGEFMRFEVWRDPEALELHKASPLIKASFERRKDQGWETEITRWRRVPEDLHRLGEH